MISEKELVVLESKLANFSLEERKKTLGELIEIRGNSPISKEPVAAKINLHAHSFFSYNAYDYSPTALAWFAWKKGLSHIGIVDFDVLDGVEEFLEACERLGLRGSAGIESRVYVPQFGEREINSPGEPGVYYDMGIGFATSDTPDEVRAQMEDIHSRVRQRNCQILERVNMFLNPLELDYEKDILPLTPSGNATERHMVARIVQKSFDLFDDPIQFWSEKLGQSKDEISALVKNPEAFKNTVRKKLMKRGGVGYVKPTAETYPRVDEFHQLIRACQAMPCAAWLDGTLQGEQDIEELLILLIEKGTAAINIIPERNWNIPDPQLKKIKVDNLYRIVDLANKLDLPILIGTEMNSFGQKFVDDLNTPELSRVKDDFVRGAQFIYGHTRFERLWKMGYQSSWAQQHFKDRKMKNDFYIQAGKRITPGRMNEQVQNRIKTSLTPDEILDLLELEDDYGK